MAQDNARDADVTTGFVLAIQVFRSLGVPCDHQAMLLRLHEVATRQVSLFNSPEEEVASMEQQWGVHYDQEERAKNLAAFSRRSEMDRAHSFLAGRVLENLMNKNAA